MAAAFFSSSLHQASANPYGNYRVWPTDHGICFQVTTHHPGNMRFAGALVLKSVALAALFQGGFWNFLCLLALLLPLNAVLYLGFRRVRLTWVEVRPDGFTIVPDASKRDERHFFDKRGIEQRHMEFDGGLTLRYGIHEVQATPPFAIEREFDVFSVDLEKAISRLWYQQNL